MYLYIFYTETGVDPAGLMLHTSKHTHTYTHPHTHTHVFAFKIRAHAQPAAIVDYARIMDSHRLRSFAPSFVLCSLSLSLEVGARLHIIFSQK